ncbi:MAG: hypothetical protein Q9166_007919 [cf. Caloplaca sp. 2 TL-2023]
MQTAALRYELGKSYTYDFIEGTVPQSIAPGIILSAILRRFRSRIPIDFPKGVVGLVADTTKTFTYIDKESPENALEVLADLRTQIASEGPYDGVLAFSEGAALAAMALIQGTTHSPNEVPHFRVAIFFSGGIPACPAALECGEARLLDPAVDGIKISIPTAHIWGKNDMEYPNFGPVLRELCDQKEQSVFVHDGGHEIPSGANSPGLIGAVKCIKRVLTKAEEKRQTS